MFDRRTDGLPMSRSELPLRRILLLLTIGCLAFAAAAVAAFQRTGVEFHGTRYPDTPPAPAFTLTDHHGQPASLDEFRGTPVLLFFGFTRCPDVCPLTLSTLSAIVGAGDPDLADTRILLVSVDPEHDSPDRLAAYLEAFGPAVTALTGPTAEVEKVLKEYGVYAEEREQHGRSSIVHTPVVFGIDRGGRIQVLIHADQPREIVADDIRSLARLPG